VHRTNPHIVQELLVETEDITGHKLLDTVEKFVVRLQKVQEVERSHIQRAFT